MKRILPVILLVLLVVLARSSFVLADQRLPYQRWAVLSSPEVQQSGLADLVFSKIQVLQNLELVERDQSYLMYRELAENQSFGATNVAERLKLGNQLRADGLIFLSVQEREDKRFVKLVVSDSYYGARLILRSYPFHPGQIADLAERIVKAFREVQEKYADGISRIVSVAPFVSNSLVHDYDHYQSGFGYVLEGALARLPGIAVLETEEAMAIRREAEGASSPQKNDSPILFVAGEFRAEKERSSHSVQIDMKVWIRSGEKELEEVHTRTPLSDAADWLTSDVFERVVARLSVPKSVRLDNTSHIGYLREQAGTFADLGMWEKAIGLEEASLLLEPTDIELRKNLVFHHGYASLSLSPFTEQLFVATHRDESKIEASTARSVTAYLSALAHLEYLVRNRRVMMVNAIAMTRETNHVWNTLLNGINAYAYESKSEKWWRKQYERADSAEMRMMTEIYPLVKSLAKEENVLEELGDRFFQNIYQETLIGSGLGRCARASDPERDLDYLKRVLCESKIVPDKTMTHLRLSALLWIILKRRAEPEMTAHWFTENPLNRCKNLDRQWIAFLEELGRTENLYSSFFGRYGLLEWHWQREKKSLTPERAGRMLDESEKLLEMAVELGLDRPWDGNPNWDGGIYAYIKGLRDSVVPQGGPYRQGAQSGKKPAQRPEPVQMADRETRLRFEPISFQASLKNGIREKQGNRIWTYEVRKEKLVMKPCGGTWDVLPCGKTLDVFWNEGCVFFMREKGGIHQVLPDGKAFPASDIAWDGAHVWVASKEQGLLIITPDGQIVDSIGEENGLPPAENGIFLHALRPGQVLAVGSFGKDFRAWCANITLHDPVNGRRVGVAVFHEATRLPPDYDYAHSRKTGREIEQLMMDPGVRFVPTWLHAYENPDGSTERVMVGRDLRTKFFRRHNPLVIDPGSLSVSVMGWKSYFFGQNKGSFFSRKGEFFESTGNGVVHWAPEGKTWGNGKNWEILCTEKPVSHLEEEYKESILGTNLTNPRRLLHVGDWLYVPGETWWRVNPATLKQEKLGPWQWQKEDEENLYSHVPPQLQTKYAGVSAHYGLVAWGSHTGFYRVTTSGP